jgi:hypothetical protein
VASKAVILLADDGAAISITSRAEDLDARAFVIAEGFQDFLVAASAAVALHGGQAFIDYDGQELGIQGPEGISAGTGTALVWDPREDLKMAARHLDGSKLVDTAFFIEDELRLAHEAGRSHEGIHGDGPFAAAFARLRDDPAFPANLVGFGPGSTPAGDDWLSGYLTGRDLVEGGPGLTEPALRSALRAAFSRTTASGRALLTGALTGAPPAYIVGLVVATMDIALESSVRAAVRTALGHGATSGEDALAGFIRALRTSPKAA